MIHKGSFASSLQVVAWAGVAAFGLQSVSAQAPIPNASSLSPAQPPNPAQAAASPPLTVLEDTLIRVQTLDALSSKKVKDGFPVLFTVSEGVFVGDALAIPVGATVHGVVVNSRKSGVLTGSPELELKLVSLDLGGRNYPLESYHFKVKGASKAKPTETKAICGAYVGALLGTISNPSMGRTVAGRAASASTDAAIGAGMGTLVSAVTPGPGIWFPSERQVDFYLAAPVTVTPVSAKEAARLARGLRPGGPVLYLRGETP